jgi:glycosyltransferase involved in cell wall biosynthesis
MDGPLAAGVIAVILKGYPRLSETFIAQELHALEARGVALALFSLRHPTDRETHPIHAAIRAPVVYLPEYLHDEPTRVWRAWRAARHLPGYPGAIKAWWRDFRRDPTRSRIRRLGQAFVLAAELPREVVQLHAHFLHTPASVTLYAAILRDLPWSCSAHAKDIWTTPDWDKREKLAEMAWLVTCTAAGQSHLAALAPTFDRVGLVYHGLDLARFGAPDNERDDRAPGRPVTILSVGRAVEKKGFDDLLGALSQLPRDLKWRFIHVGGGPLLAGLKAQAEQLGLAERITWRGAQPQDVVLQLYRDADVFVLASRVAGDGDRDGLPNVLMEAMSQRVAVVATKVGGVEELIEDGVTGLLVSPRDIAGLGHAMTTLMGDPRLRARLAGAGHDHVHRHFDLETRIDQLAARFGVAKAAPAAGVPACA